MPQCPKCHSDEIADYLTQNEGYEGYLVCLKCYYLWKPKIQVKPRPQPRSTIDEDIREDSEGDGLMLFDDPMFPPEDLDED